MLEKENNLEIAIASDSNYAEFVSILLLSIFDNNKEFEHINIHLLSNSISDNALSIIKLHIPKDKGSLFIYDLSNIRALLGVEVPDTISITAYSRLFLSTLLPSKINKIIYLDTDAIIAGSLFKLWNLDLQDYLVAGVLDDVSNYAKKSIRLKDNDEYINSGFLLINIEFWRKENIESKILNYLIEHNGKVFHHDQGLINYICNKRKLILPIEYNMVTNFFIFPYTNFQSITPFYTEEELKYGIENPIFIHFTSGVANRPWMLNCKHPLKNKFLKYRDLSYYKDFPLYPDNRKVSLKILAFCYFYCRPFYYFLLKVRSLVKE